MLDIGWAEMAVIAVVALIVLGPKEIPNALKTAAHWMRTARKMAREFQSGVDQIVREAELDEARKTITQAGGLNLGKEIEKVVDPTGETKRALNTDPTKAIGPAGAGAASAGAASRATASPQIAAPAPAATQASSATPATAPSPPSPASPPASEVASSGAGSATERTPDAPPEPAAAGERRA